MEEKLKAARDGLATIVVYLTVLGIIVLGIVAITSAKAETKSEVAFRVLNLLLPVLGVWMGTVMAFYFSKENYEAAARHAIQASQASQPGSASPVITTVTTPYKDMPKTEVPDGTEPDQIKLMGMFPKEFVLAIAKGEINTIPRNAVIREKTKQVVYVVHPTTVADYAASASGIQAAKNAGGLSNLTIADLKRDNATLFARLQNWVTVGPNDKISDAKFAMDGKKGCHDVFVTDNGRSDGAVLGWATEGKINRAA